ncbi:MAG: hypothetical protein IJ955_10255 [Oscillospiraceae bacterium]|nr:hypothetical protein [Oscillospiraceae bacterium]
MSDNGVQLGHGGDMQRITYFCDRHPCRELKSARELYRVNVVIDRADGIGEPMSVRMDLCADCVKELTELLRGECHGESD